MLLKIRELKIEDGEDNATGVQAISFVDKPAILTDFEYFAKAPVSDYFLYQGPLDAVTRPFCKERAGRIFSSDEIRKWNTDPELRRQVPQKNDPQKMNFVNAPTDAKFFENFDGYKGGPDYQGNFNFNVESQMFGCRHKLKRVELQEEDKSHFFSLEMVEEEKREVMGLVLKSNQFIFRKDVDNMGNPGYVYFSRDTVRKLKDKYGYNRSISFMHRDDLTGQAILLDSYLEEDDIKKETRWFVKYKIVGEKLWNQIRSKNVKGFSIEALFSINKPI